MEPADRNHNDEGGGDDRLSTLPDDILTEILSRLPINCATCTSVLSHRWRHLWTKVTRLEYRPISTTKLSHILRHLTSPKLDVFKIEVPTYSFDYGDALQSCIHDICRRNVQQVISNIFFPIPDCLLNCRSLVILDLFGPFARKYQYRAVHIQLPNLKKLSLRYLTYLPHWLCSLHKSSPLLEVLTLRFTVVFAQPPNAMPSMNIFFPNLKSLELGLFPFKVEVEPTPGFNPIFSIDAPKLTNLVTYGSVSLYRFSTNPTALVKACIDLGRCEERDDDPNDEGELHRFSEFFKGMYSISNLELVVIKWQMDIFTYLNVNPPMFSNLVRLKVNLYGFGLNGCSDLLVSLQCFPNLEHLWVILMAKYKSQLEQRSWRAPDAVPSCLISKLKTMKIKGIGGNDGWLNFLRYILGNAKVLQNLNVCWVDELSQQVEPSMFCRSLFKLPRSSLTCEVVFSGSFITLSSNVFKIGKHNVNWPWLIDIFCCYFWYSKRQFNIQANIEGNEIQATLGALKPIYVFIIGHRISLTTGSSESIEGGRQICFQIEMVKAMA